MVGATALMLMQLCAGDAKPAPLRMSLEPRWTVGAATALAGPAYRRDPDRFVARGARVSVDLSPNTSLFMQARKPAADLRAEPVPAAQGRAYSLGMALRW